VQIDDAPLLRVLDLGCQCRRRSDARPVVSPTDVQVLLPALPGLRPFRPLLVGESREDLFADLQPLKGEATASKG